MKKVQGAVFLGVRLQWSFALVLCVFMLSCARYVAEDSDLDATNGDFAVSIDIDGLNDGSLDGNDAAIDSNQDTLSADTVAADTVAADTVAADTVAADTVAADTVPADTMPTCLQSNWLNGFWLSRQELIYKHAGTLTHTNFVVVVNIDFNQNPSLLGQKDILRFGDDSGVLLPHEIEVWNESAKRATIWVKLNALIPGDNKIWVYYNSSDASRLPALDFRSTWDSDFLAVWHMNPNSTLGSQSVLDSTTNQKHGDPVLFNSNDVVQGKTGDALLFNGVSEYVRVPSSSTDVLAPKGGAVTIEAWISGTSLTTTKHVFGRQYGTSTSDALSLFLWGNATPAVSLISNTISSGTSVSEGVWHYLVATITTSGIKIYIDGALDRAAYESVTFNFDDNDFTIGAQENGPSYMGEFFSGMIDEVRYSKTERSADWIRAQYRSMNSQMAAWGNVENCQ